MGRRDRWAYLARPGFFPKSDRCPECEEPSKVYFIGARTVDGVKITRHECEHGHAWSTEESWEAPDTPS